jgi:RecA/RadA recombinase
MVASESKFFDPSEEFPTSIPIINAAFSGKLNGGFSSGLTVLAGPSKHFKSLMGLMMCKAFQKKHDDGVVLFFDSEFGIKPDYLESIGIDSERVLHIPVEHIEQLKFEIVAQLNNLDKKDNVMIFIDSVGNLASKKEVEDAADMKSVADMTRAKALKSLFRIITPSLRTKDVPCVVVNHIYMEQGLFPKAIVSGGTGIYYSADNIFIIGRSQEKEGKDVAGYTFTVNIEKSRVVREKSKFPFTVKFEGGIDPFSGLLDLGLSYGLVTKPSNGYYTRVLADENGEAVNDKKWRMKETSCIDFWRPLLASVDFREYIEDQFRLNSSDLVDGDVADELAEELNEFLEA